MVGETPSSVIERLTYPKGRDQLLYLMASCNRAVIYYAGETARRAMYGTVIQVVVLVSAFGSVSAVVGVLSDVIPVGIPIFDFLLLFFNLIVSFGVVMSLTWNHPHKVSQLHTTSAKCRDVLMELQNLSVDFDDESASSVKILSQLAEKLNQATAPIETSGIGFSKKRNDKAHDRAWKIVYDRTGIPTRPGQTTTPS